MTEDNKTDKAIAADAQEEAFFAQETNTTKTPHQAVFDIEEDELWENQEEIVIPPAWQPVAPLLLALASFLVLYAFLEDFQFALSTHQVQDLGKVQNGCPKNFHKKLPNNRMVKLGGIIPQPNLTALTRVNFSKRYFIVALGCDLLVSLSEKRYQELVGQRKNKPKRPPRTLPIPQSLRKKIGLKAKVIVQTRDELSNPKFVAQGRVLLASHTGTTANNLKRFYSVTESMSFTPHTTILFDGETPNHYWWLLIVYIILSAFCLYSFWRFVKALRNLIAPTKTS